MYLDCEIWTHQIMDWLDSGKRVFIENGCLCAEILSYKVDREGWAITGEVGTIIFETSGCPFPKEIWFTDDSNLYLKEAYGALFVELLAKPKRRDYEY